MTIYDDLNGAAHDYTNEPGLDGRDRGGIETDDGGRPVVDDGGRPVPLARPSADEVEAQAVTPVEFPTPQELA